MNDVDIYRHMDFMKFWPCDMLLKYPSQCYQKYFKNDVVLCTDSAKSNHIYIVRTVGNTNFFTQK